MKQDAKSAGDVADRSRLHRISGRHNPRLKELRQAFRRGELTSQGECAIEGVKLVEEAIRSGQRLGGMFFSGRADRGGCRSSGSGEPGHDSALCGGVRRGGRVFYRRHCQSVQLEGPARLRRIHFSPARRADFIGRTDSALAPAGRTPGRDFFAQRNCATPSHLDSASGHLHRERRRRSVARALASNGRDGRDPASCAS